MRLNYANSASSNLVGDANLLVGLNAVKTYLTEIKKQNSMALYRFNLI